MSREEDTLGAGDQVRRLLLRSKRIGKRLGSVCADQARELAALDDRIRATVQELEARDQDPPLTEQRRRILAARKVDLEKRMWHLEWRWKVRIDPLCAQIQRCINKINSLRDYLSTADSELWDVEVG